MSMAVCPAPQTTGHRSKAHTGRLGQQVRRIPPKRTVVSRDYKGVEHVANPFRKNEAWLDSGHAQTSTHVVTLRTCIIIFDELRHTIKQQQQFSNLLVIVPAGLVAWQQEVVGLGRLF